MDHGSSPVDIAQLVARVQALESHRAEDQRLIAEQRATIAAQQEALQTAHEQITLLKRALFAPKRERFVSSPDQKLLFETNLLEGAAPASPPLACEALPPRKPRTPRRKFVFPAFLPVVRHDALGLARRAGRVDERGQLGRLRGGRCRLSGGLGDRLAERALCARGEHALDPRRFRDGGLCDRRGVGLGDRHEPALRHPGAGRGGRRHLRRVAGPAPAHPAPPDTISDRGFN